MVLACPAVTPPPPGPPTSPRCPGAGPAGGQLSTARSRAVSGDPGRPRAARDVVTQRPPQSSAARQAGWVPRRRSRATGEGMWSGAWRSGQSCPRRGLEGFWVKVGRLQPAPRRGSSSHCVQEGRGTHGRRPTLTRAVGGDEARGHRAGKGCGTSGWAPEALGCRRAGPRPPFGVRPHRVDHHGQHRHSNPLAGEDLGTAGKRGGREGQQSRQTSVQSTAALHAETLQRSTRSTDDAKARLADAASGPMPRRPRSCGAPAQEPAREPASARQKHRLIPARAARVWGRGRRLPEQR